MSIDYEIQSAPESDYDPNEPPIPPEPDNPELYNWLYHWFIRYSDIGAARSSVMGYISQKSDKSFKPYNFKSIPHWNTSIESLNQQYKRLLGDDPTNGLIEWIIENT